MTRSLSKGPYVDVFLKKSNFLQKLENGKPCTIWSRRSTILPLFVNKSFQIYNGKTFISLLVTEEMIGHKFGEFASTRKKGLHKLKGKKK
jgi:small subunit ribosomal protein S19